MNDIKVSVIVPVYNSRPFLKKCLDSICGQTLKEIEILCVDDQSSDGSHEILEEYARKDKRIRIINNRHVGSGAASARNRGLKEAKGKYLSFLDSDDYFDWSMLQKAYDKAVALDTDIVMYDALLFEDNTGKEIQTKDVLQIDMFPGKEVFSGSDYPKEIFISTIGAAWNMLFRHTFIKKHHLSFQSLYHADDFFFAYGALAVADRITIINEKLIFYRKGNINSQSYNKGRAPLAAVQACEKLKEWLEKKNLYALYEQGFHNVAVRYCNFYIETMDCCQNFVVLYDALKKKYFHEFGFDKIEEGELIFESLYDWIQRIGKYDKEEFLFNRLYGNKHAFGYGTNKLFPVNLIKPQERIILYGAGDSGKAYYIQNVVNGYCNIVGWTDKNARQMYESVEEIHTVLKRDFDRILIAIENRTTAEQVKDYLMRSGVEEKKIIWYSSETAQNEMAGQKTVGAEYEVSTEDIT